MFRKTLIALGTTLAIAGGSLGATATTASAGGPDIVISFGGGYGPGFYFGDHGPHKNKICKPVYKTKKVFKNGHWKVVKVKVGKKCKTIWY